MTDTEIKIADWMVGDDTGLSSRFMARSFLGGLQGGNTPHHPLDPSDFGRCHRLLDAVPGLRDRLSELKGRSEVWDTLIENWPYMTDLYIKELPKGTAPLLYDYMKNLGC